MWQDPSFYILISFLLFVGFMGVPLYRKTLLQLKERSSTIARQLQEVDALHQEAEAILVQQKKAFEHSKKELETREKEVLERLERIEKEGKESLNKLDEQSDMHLKREMESLKDSVKEEIYQELIQRTHKSVQWILENKLTDGQREAIASEAIERVKEL